MHATCSAERGAPSGAGRRVPHPWLAADLARLYDVFPFDADVPYYLGLAGEQRGPVLEVASGSGRVLLPLARSGHRLTGLDASPAMLALAREKLQAAGPEVMDRATLIEADMRSFALGETFGLAIIAAKSFAYLLTPAEQLQALRTIASHLQPGGLLALDLHHPRPAWLLEPPGSLRQDLAQDVPEQGVTVLRTETAVSTDLANQIRVIRSAYEIVATDGSVTKRFVEWPYRYIYRFEAEHLLERAGLTVEALYGGYEHEPFTSDSPMMLLLARR